MIGCNEAFCDVVLLDRGIEERHAILSLDDSGGVRLTLLATHSDGEDAVNARAVAPLAMNVSFTLGLAELIVVAGAGGSTNAATGIKHPVAPAAAGSPSTAVYTEKNLGVQRGRRKWGGRIGRVATLAVTLVVIAVIGAASPLQPTSASPDYLVEAKQRLKVLGFANLDVVRRLPGDVVISGYVSNEADIQRLSAAFRLARKPIELEVQVKNAVQQFDSGLATSRYQLTAVRPGDVMLDGQQRTPSSTPAASGSSNRGKPDLRLRIRSVSMGENVYIETDSGQHFYRGSMLPGGYTLAGVTADGIVVTKGAKRFVLDIN
ncbi:hypothetical protein WJ62_02980 [Burkholderia diffusa]|nr:hypothetical protein WJ62_02980 [Burkholderia diffusa]